MVNAYYTYEGLRVWEDNAWDAGDLFQNSGYSDEFRFYYCGFRELWL